MSRAALSSLLLALAGAAYAACGTGPTLELGDNLREPLAGDVAGSDAGERDEREDAAGSADASARLDAGAAGQDAGRPDECTVDDECESGERSRCEDGECVECITAADCTDPERPFCSAGTCAECESLEDCNDEPSCPRGEGCATCAADTDCTDRERPICAETGCVECTQDADCAGEELGVCDRVEGECR